MIALSYGFVRVNFVMSLIVLPIFKIYVSALIFFIELVATDLFAATMHCCECERYHIALSRLRLLLKHTRLRSVFCYFSLIIVM